MRGLPHRHLLGIEQLSRDDILFLLDEAEPWIGFSRGRRKQVQRLAGLTQCNVFFENSTRTLFSFEVAGKRLGAQVANFHAIGSSVQKGETLIATALTLNAMRPDVMVIRHAEPGAPHQVAEVVDCPVINAGARADDPERSAVNEQVEMGVAVRMAVLDVLTREGFRLPSRLREGE